MALASHHGVRQALPVGMRPDGLLRDGRPFAAPRPLSAHFQLLPFLDLNQIYNSANIPSYPLVYSPSLSTYTFDEKNMTVVQVTVAGFLCPSDSIRLAPGIAYRASIGPNPHLHDGTPWPGGGGAFAGLIARSYRDFTDGLSQTTAFSERSGGSGGEMRFRPAA